MNAYQTAFATRVALAKTTCSASNAKKLDKLSAMLNSELCALLDDAKIDASVFNRAIYACEKLIKFSSQAIKRDASNLNDNAYAAFRTAVNAYRHNAVLTQHMLEASISNIAIDDSVKHIVYRRANAVSDATVPAQAQQVRDFLKSLNIIEARADAKHAFNVKMTKLTKALCKSFEIETAKA